MEKSPPKRASTARRFGAIRQLTAWRHAGLAGALGYGFVFSLGTSVAPLLLLLTISAAQGRTDVGVHHAFAFGVGRALPFLVLALVASALTRFTRFQSWRRPLEIVSGCGLLLVSGYYGYAFIGLL